MFHYPGKLKCEEVRGCANIDDFKSNIVLYKKVHIDLAPIKSNREKYHNSGCGWSYGRGESTDLGIQTYDECLA